MKKASMIMDAAPYIILVVAAVVVISVLFAPKILSYFKPVQEIAQKYMLTKSEENALDHARSQVAELLDTYFITNHKFTSDGEIKQYVANISDRLRKEQDAINRNPTINTPYLNQQFNDLIYELEKVNQPYVLATLYFTDNNRKSAMDNVNLVVGQNEKFAAVAKAKTLQDVLNCKLNETQCKKLDKLCYYKNGLLWGGSCEKTPQI